MTIVANADKKHDTLDETQDKLEVIQNQMDYLKTKEIDVLTSELITLGIQNACYRRMFTPPSNSSDPKAAKTREHINKACEAIGCGYKPKACDS